MDAFRDTIDTCGLADIGYQGTPWTFEKRVTGGTYTRVRLDRCVASPEWSLAFPSAKLEHKNTASSDHAATLLTLADDAFNVRPRSFRYELMWERHPDFMDMPGRSGPNHLETKVMDRLVELYHREEILWRQRARIEWLSHGDKNTYFFHLRASRRRRKNKIKALQHPDGGLTEDTGEMEDMVNSFYQHLYNSEGVHDMERVIGTVSRKVMDEMNAQLDAPYSQQEVKDALF
ncbi:uncharacterized protein [Aegilops tauschii subsp. strangulata]|uniref:uncharacterized protein n=1 Tax=Aegilops tauschii subsp. strangulata TaxID=200361 RepID=UPI003CC8D952